MSTMTEKPTPAYPPYRAFDSFISRLKGSGVTPPEIHKSLMPNMSGGLQSQVLTALKFLQLIDEDNRTRPELKGLVDAHGTAAYKPALAKILDKAYKPVIGDLDVKTAIGKMLKERFKDHTAVDGETLKKAMRFYIKALKDAGVKVSPHIIDRDGGGGPRRASGDGKPTGSSGRRPKPDPDPADDDQRHNGKLTPPPKGMIQIPIYSPGKEPGHILVHEDLNEADCAMINAILMAHAKRRETTTKK